MMTRKVSRPRGSRSRLSVSAPTPIAEKEHPAPSSADPAAKLHIDDVSLRQLQYEELGQADVAYLEGLAPPVSLNVSVTLTGGIQVQTAERAVVMLQFRCEGDKRAQPLAVSGVYSFAIRRDPGFPTQGFVQFLSRNVAVLAIPYIREVVANVTSRGIFTTLTIDPLVAQPFLTVEQERHVTAEIENAIRSMESAAAGQAPATDADQ